MLVLLSLAYELVLPINEISNIVAICLTYLFLASLIVGFADDADVDVDDVRCAHDCIYGMHDCIDGSE